MRSRKLPLYFMPAVASLCQVVQVTAENGTWPILSSGYTDAVQWDHYSFLVNEERTFLFGGEMHPFRLPVPEMWDDVVQKIKAAGMNAMSFYSMWGMHEQYQSQLDLTTASRNLSRLLQYAADAGIYVIARPGPYINAELSAGGFPIWLTTGAFGTLRSNGTAYSEAWRGYIAGMARLVSNFQIHKNGTVIAWQVENEYPRQWRDKSANTPDQRSISYMEKLEATVRANGIEIPTTHNNPGADPDWSRDYDTVGAGGDVDVWGQDSYPLCWSCDPDTCGGAYAQWTLLDYYDYRQEVAANSPGLLPEFQGGKVVPLTGGASDCAASVGPDFRNIYLRHNVDQQEAAIMQYMIAGGTNWGWIGVPFIGTSYDYTAPIAEDRTLRDSWYEIKSLALFTRVAQDLRKVDRHNASYTDNDSVTAIRLLNPDNGAAFYVVRHTDSAADAPEAFRLRVSTSLGDLTIPQDTATANGKAWVAGHISKILVTDFHFANKTILYSTAEVLTWAVFDGSPTIIFTIPPGESGQFAVVGGQHGSVLRCDRCSSVGFSPKNAALVVDFTQGRGMSVLQIDEIRVILVDRYTAWEFFVPPLSSNPKVPEDETAIVRGPYLVRRAAVGDVGTLALSGDTNITTKLEVFAPKGISKIIWNGVSVTVEKTSYGSLTGYLPGPEDFELPTLTGWKTMASLPERFVNYSDTGIAWSVPDGELNGVLYGFQSGYLLWRGTFTGSAATGLYLSVEGGDGFGFSVYLNGVFLSSFLGHDDAESGNVALNLDNSTVSLSKDKNVLLVLQDNTGHDETGSETLPRGILNATLLGGDGLVPISWKVAGTAGSNSNTTVDSVRGPYNEGGLVAERLGWHLPGFDDSTWAISSPADGIPDAGVQFYRTTVTLDLPDGHDAAVAFTFENPRSTKCRALLYVNGYQYGRYFPHVADANSFPVPPGVLDYGGKNEIAVVLWSQDREGASVEVDWEVRKLTQSSVDAKFDGAYLRPSWTSEREKYA